LYHGTLFIFSRFVSGLAIDSLVREIGKRVMENRIPRRGVFDYYVKREG
jgi:hypothetical protein